MKKVVGVFFFLVLLLSLRWWWYFGHLSGYREGERLDFVATLTEEPTFSSGKEEFSLSAKNGQPVQIITSLSHLYHYGDRLEVVGSLTSRVSGGRISCSLYFPKIEQRTSTYPSFAAMAYWLRNKAVALYQSVLPTEEASLLLGIVLGGNVGLNSNFLHSLRSVGVVHVISASGMNVTFVAGALIAVLGSFLPRRVALVFGMFGVVFYGFLAGFTASVLRACLMAFLSFGAGFWGRQYYGVASLFLTAFVLLFCIPILIVDVGFWLSFLSTFGILVIQPLFDWGKKWYLADLATTFSAQIATLPVMLGVFGQYGLLSLIANGLVLWMIPFLMTVGSGAIVVGLLFPFLGGLLLYLSLPFLWFFNLVVNWLGGVGWVIKVHSIPWEIWVGYYCLLGAWIWVRRTLISDVRLACR